MNGLVDFFIKDARKNVRAKNTNPLKMNVHCQTSAKWRHYPQTSSNINLKWIFVFTLVIFVVDVGCFAQIPSNPPNEEDETSDDHIPGSGFSLIKKEKATLNFSVFTTTRYLNQKGLNESYTDYFGRSRTLDRRNDIQFQKVMLYFKGWLANPNFRYVFYVWTSNTSQGQGAQVVLAGNLQYKINKHLDVGVGIGGLPTSRSLLGQWPLWLREDARPMAEEFFRGSFTTGIWAQGEITKGLYYKTMLGNNLSQLGIDAGQLDDGFDTWSTALWRASPGYGRLAPFGDYQKNDNVATLFGGAYTRSNETWQSQPGSEAPENSQIRLSDGTGIFSLNAFDNGSQVLAAKYQMASLNGGIKYKGFSLDAEYYWRWISNFETNGQLPVSKLSDNGYSIQGSAMLVDKTLMMYSTYSYINGEYGKPWEFTMGLNWYVLKSRWLRINPEVIFVDRSPVGYLSYPTVVGATGTVFMVNLELFY